MKCPRCRGLVIRELLVVGGRISRKRCLLCGWDDIPRIYVPKEKLFSLRGFAHPF